PATATLAEAVSLWKTRWHVEAGLSTTQGGAGPGPLRGTLLGGLPPSRDAVFPGVRLPGPGALARQVSPDPDLCSERAGRLLLDQFIQRARCYGIDRRCRQF